MGIGQVIGGICRCLGPLLIPAWYSWTCGKHQWLINPNFTFIVSLENWSNEQLLGSCGCICALFMIGVSHETNNPKGSLGDVC